MRKLLLSDTPARILVLLAENPGLTTNEIAERVDDRCLPTIYPILANLCDRKMFTLEEIHSSHGRDGRPSYAYTLSAKGHACARLYKELFDIENEKVAATAVTD